MALVNPPGFAAIKLVFRLDGDAEEFINTFGVENEGNLSADDVAGACAGAFDSGFPGSTYSNGLTFVGVEAQLGSDGGTGEVGTYSFNNVGTMTSAILPQNCAALVQKRTALGGRKGRGRLYLPSGFLAEAQVNAQGVLSNTLVTDLQDCADEFLSQLTTLEVPMVLFHENSPPVPTPVTALVVDPLIATQRRRLRK